MLVHEDRLFPAEPSVREIARRLYHEIRDLPLICPHGHTDPAWFSENKHFTDPATLLVKPDQNIFKLLFSQGIPLEKLGFLAPDDSVPLADARDIWRVFASHYNVFLGTPTRLWLDHTFQHLFELNEVLSAENTDHYFEHISSCLGTEEFRPRALYERFGIEVLATTDFPTDDLSHHSSIQSSDWQGRIIPTYRGDPVIDPDYEGFSENLRELGRLTGQDCTTWNGYLEAHRIRRAFFIEMGATATDHGHPTPRTADLTLAEAEALFARVISEQSNAADRELFRAQMLTEMAGMSVEDGLVMQLHAGSQRNHSEAIFRRYGRDMGFDFPKPTSYIDALKPLLDRFGLDSRLTLILFTLDESSYSRELAPLAAGYPSVRLGPAWWFFDSPAGMLRYRQLITETAGFCNTAGFNDDARSLTSLAARHDMARRIDCAFLADQVSRHLLSEQDANEIAYDLAYGLAKTTYRL